jgi:putative Mg2+ transporter-C (MgtC) family protein
MQMPLFPTWNDIIVRLVLTIFAGALLGFNREARGHAAGLRTTILVALAASIAMIQANILLPLDGKQSSSFAVMDLMRLPLGILTGVGFLGGWRHPKEGRLDYRPYDRRHAMDCNCDRTLFRRRPTRPR